MINSTRSQFRILLVASASALTLGGGSALAQTTGASAPTQVTEIIVTANKREERLKDVAMAVTAIGGATAAVRQQLDLQDLATSVPDLNLQQGSVANSTKAVIRGENSGSDGATVASVMDDVPISFSASNEDGAFLATDPDTYDLSRVEVLKGPQGTLYGAVAEGGIIKYVTNAPNPNGFHSGFEVGGLSIDHGGEDGSAKGYVNIPFLDDKAALRITGFYEGIPGWEDNGMLNKKDVNGGEKYGGRASVLVQATPDLTIRATAHLQYLDTDGEDKVDVQGANSPSDPFALLHGYNYYTYSNDLERSSMTIYSLNVTYNLHVAQLQSITSYGTLGLHFLEDQPYLFGLFGPGTSTQQRQTDGLKKFNQELRLSSEPGNEFLGHKLEWQTGLFYTDEQNIEDQYFDILSYPQHVRVGNGLAVEAPASYQDVAAYADVTYHFTPQFDIEVGGRYSYNWQTSQVTEGGALFGGTTTAFAPTNTDETSGTYSVAPRWHLTSNTLLYARVATGYRPGGPQIPLAGAPPSLPKSFMSDSTINYEAGVKTTLFDGRVSADVSLFYIDWTRIQIESDVVVNGNQYFIAGNGGSAVSKGVEWNFDWLPVSGLNVQVVGSYDQAYLTANAPGAGGLSGDELAYVPNLTSSLNVDYEWRAFGDYKAFVGGSWSYIGSRYTDFSTTPGLGHIQLPGYDTFSLHGGVRDGRYTVEAYVKNLADARGITNYEPTQGYLNNGTAAIIRPRTIGVRVAADF